MLYRKIARESNRTLLLLAPEASASEQCFSNVQVVPDYHRDLLKQTQELRGRVYLAEGAIERWQLSEGRHELDVDESSWHILLIDQQHRVCGCARYLEYSSWARFRDLGVFDSAIARSEEWGTRLRRSIEQELQLARSLQLPFVELGGWALTEEIRATAEAVRMALLTYGLSQALGGGVGISTATKRNSSSSILRKIGGRSLGAEGVEIPAYYDPHYRCEMEVLKFYSWLPNPKYAEWIEAARLDVSRVPVVARTVGTRATERFAAATAAGA